MDSNNEANDLQESIAQYEIQLNQIKSTLAVTKSGPEYDSLFNLQNDIEELIKLTKENVSGLQHQSQTNESERGDPFEDEYALFKAELEKEDGYSNEVATNDVPLNASNHSSNESAIPDIKSELATLQGSKCQAPFTDGWDNGGECTSYHNALVMSVEEIDGNTNNIEDIMVKVMYTNPLNKRMVPCPYFLEGDCKFDDNKCRYSHGAVIPFSKLREYKEPNFSNIQVGCRVLAKQLKDSLWQYASVLELISDDVIKVKFNTSAGGTVEINLHDVLPLEDNDESRNKSTCKDDLGESSCTMNAEFDKGDSIDDNMEAIIHLSLLRAPASSNLGDWEKYTKGIGSRLMANMGYIIGSGLGLRGDGRLEPVEALVYPPGKSLDHCMHLRESAGGDHDMFKAEKRRLKKQVKEDKRRAKEYEKEKQKVDVFSFINNTLAGKSNNSEKDETNARKNLAGSSRKGLNVEKFCIGEDIRRAEKDLVKLKESLLRHPVGSTVHKHITNRVMFAETELNKLRESERSISREQNMRANTKKLSLF